MTIWAKKSNISNIVVRMITIDMIDFDRDQLSIPLCQKTFFAFLPTVLDKTNSSLPIPTKLIPCSILDRLLSTLTTKTSSFFNDNFITLSAIPNFFGIHWSLKLAPVKRLSSQGIVGGASSLVMSQRTLQGYRRRCG